MYDQEDKVSCKTPTKGKSGTTRIPRWKYDCIRTCILACLHDAGGDGVGFRDLSDLVGAGLSEEERANLGSLGWHVTTVKLNMEVEGEISRITVSGRQSLVRA